MVQLDPPLPLQGKNFIPDVFYVSCYNCNVHLCEAHFKIYYDMGHENIIHSSIIDNEISATDQVKKSFYYYSLLDPTENI